MQQTGLLLLIALATPAFGANSEQVREAATRAVRLIQATQKAWPAKQSCTSCHHQFQPAIAFRLAREHGIPVDETIARASDSRTFDCRDINEAIQYQFVGETAMADAYRLVAADAAGVKPNLYTAAKARLIAARQGKDGDWNSFHSRPPSSYSSFTMTAIALRSLQLYGHPSQREEMKASIARGRDWLAGHQPSDAEGRTFQLLGLHWAGADKAVIAKAANALKATQRPDGGWGQADGRASEAYSTGEALTALAESGQLRVKDKAFQRGVEFLTTTQAADGSWHVPTRLLTLPVSPPYFESGYPYGHDQFISIHGSAWAVMAMSHALGGKATSNMPALEGIAPAAEPWVEKVMFGSAAELKKMLEEGFDANSATASGGTTALMVAAPDVEKIKLLLDRGANVNARAKSKYSALLVAAQFPKSTAAIQLLLARGAEVRPPKDQGKPMFNASALFLASYAGNVEVLPALKSAGDSLDETYLMFGTFPITPLFGAALLGDVASARALLDLGAPIDQNVGGGTALTAAVLGHQLGLAKLLIERGADVNFVDPMGGTPLLWAAATDFGDTAMVDLLVKAGAKRDARTKEGLSAAQVAKKLGRNYLVAKLERD